MKKIYRDALDPHTGILGKLVQPEDIYPVVDISAEVYVNGECVAIYEPQLGESPELLSRMARGAFSVASYDIGPRASALGMRSRSTTFGGMPRMLPRNRRGRRARGERINPRSYEAVIAIGKNLSSMFELRLPEAYQAQAEKVSESIASCWRFGDTIPAWTGAILNKSTQLAYHYDRNNLYGSWSGQFVSRAEGGVGGDLVCPEIGLTFKCNKGACLVFRNELLLHGVSPMRVFGGAADRYSVIFYTTRGLAELEPSIEEEDRHFRKNLTVRQHAHAKSIRENRERKYLEAKGREKGAVQE